MENNQTHECTGTDFNDLWDALKSHNLVACSDQKTSLGASPQPYIKNKNIVKMAMPPALKQKMNQSPPIGKRSDEIWGAIHLLIKAGYSNDEIIKRIMDNPIGEKAHEKTDPYNWLKPQVLKARHEGTSSKAFDGRQILDDTIARAQNNKPEAVFDQPFIDTMCDLKKSNIIDFEKYRQKTKNIKGVPISRFDKLVQAEETKEKKSSVQNYYEVLEPITELFRDQAGKPHIAFLNDDGTKLVMLLNSSEATQQISYETHRRTNNIIDSNALKSLIMLMEGYAANNKDVRDVFIRHAFYDGAYYTDLCNDFHDVIKIDKKVLQITTAGNLLFRRTQTMKPFPSPVPQGDVTLLWKYIIISKPEQLLLLAWIMECFRPNTQYPIMELHGEKGSGKSEWIRIIRALIDPNDNDVLITPKDEESLIAAAVNNAVLCYDNLAKMNKNFQNLLCTVATGGSVSTRRYFTNFDEASAKIMKPVIFNSIDGLVTQTDLADRTIRITLQKIEIFIPVSELRENFMKDYPIIFSGILDLFSRALRRIPHIKPDGKARMGDFLILGEAVSQELGNDAGYFSQILRQNKIDYAYEKLMETAVGSAVVSYFEEEEAQPFKKTSISNVKNRLEGYSDFTDEWPETEKKMASELRKLTPLFEEIGLKIQFHSRKGGGVPITIKKSTNENSND